MAHDNWHTPSVLLHVLRQEFPFDLDAAATKENTVCTRFLSLPDSDALTTPWEGRTVWCNPPYTHLPAFVARMWDQCVTQQTVVVGLIPAYTDPRYWWEIVIPHADEVRFLKGRLSFLDGGQRKESARYPSVVVVFRWRPGLQQRLASCWWWDWKATREAGKAEAG